MHCRPLHCQPDTECVLLLQVALGLGTAFVWACIVLLLVVRHKIGQLFTSDVGVLHLVALTIPAMSLSLLCECRTSASWHACCQHTGAVLLRHSNAPCMHAACGMWRWPPRTRWYYIHTAVPQDNAAALVFCAVKHAGSKCACPSLCLRSTVHGLRPIGALNLHALRFCHWLCLQVRAQTLP
jgi:hypothetical protein